MKSLKTFLYLLVIISLSATNLFAQDGTLDPTFGVDGIIKTNVYVRTIQEIKILEDNTMLSLATNDSIGSFLFKTNEDGTFDEMFGENGIVDLPINIDTLLHQFTSFDIDGNGNIILCGYATKQIQTAISKVFLSNYFVIRLSASGVLDTSFGENGWFKSDVYEGVSETDLHSLSFNINSIIDDNIMFSVRVDNEDDTANVSLNNKLIFLNNSGTIDNTIEVGNNDGNSSRTYLEVDNLGNIIVVHTTYDEVKIYKYYNDGTKDLTFGTNGYYKITREDLGLSTSYTIDDGALAIGPRNNIFYSINISKWEGSFSKVLKLFNDGKLDASFGLNGFKTIDLSNFSSSNENRLTDIQILGDGTILFSGLELSGLNAEQSFLAKLLKNGDYDNSFANDGLTFTTEYYDPDFFQQYVDYLFDINSDNQKITAIYNRGDSLFISRYLNSRNYSSTHVSGDVAGKWENIDTVYVDGNITIPEDSTLQIYPGTNVYFTGEYEFNVYGTLYAQGTESDSVFFFSDSLGWISDFPNYKGFWYGITFHSTDLTNQSTSILNYCSIKYGFGRWLDEASPEFNRRFGGGLIYYKSEINVKNTRLTDCQNGHYKGGVISSIYSSGDINNVSMVNAGSVCLLDSEININGLNTTRGDGLYIENSTGNIENLGVSKGIGAYNYGIVHFENSNFILKNSEIINNTYAVGVMAKSSTLTIERTLIKGNGSDGGLFIESPIIIKNCEILENGRDGLSFNSETEWQTIFTSYIDNSIIAKNRDVGMRFQANNNGFVTNCTIADNTSSNSRGGIKTLDSEVHVKNSIVYQNGSNFDYQTLGFFTYSIVQGFYPGSDTATTNLQNVDPLFRDAENGDYHLQSIACGNASDSPGIDAGDPNMGDYVLDCATAGLGTKLADIGAYGGEGNWWDESVVPFCHFKGEVSGTWECETIYVDGDILIPYGDTLNITEAVNRVIITGPYQIKVEGILLAVGPEDDRAETDLNGDFIIFQGSSWKGIFFNNLNDSEVGKSIISNCRFDYADKMDMTYQGGGAIAIYNSDNVEVKHSVFYANSARYGGAMYIENSNAHIEDCYFELNGKEIGQNTGALTTAGGALYIKTSNPYLHKLQFINNYSILGGGAVVVDNSSITMSNILLAKNETEGMGGAVEVLSNVNGSLLKIANMTSTANIAMQNGGGSFHTHGENTELEVINSIMYDNTKVELYVEGKTPIITYSIIDSASTESYFGEGCSEDNPYFADGTRYKLSNNSCSYSDGNTVVSTAIDAGHPDSLDAILDCYEGLGTSRADMGYYGGRYSDMIVSVEDEVDPQIPNKYELAQNYPNPFNPSTTIQFAIPKAGIVSLKIYNILGEEIATLINREMNAGFQKISFDASYLSSGIYFYRISVGNFVDVKKMIFMK